MSVEFPLLNLLMSLVPLLILSVIAFFVAYKLRFLNRYFVGAVIAIFALSVWSKIHTGAHSPRVVINEESGFVQREGGEISSSAPERQTDEERLNQNQHLYEQNK